MSTSKNIKSILDEYKSSVIFFSLNACIYCDKLENDLKAMQIPYCKYNLSDQSDLREQLTSITSRRMYPQLFIGGEFIGGYNEFVNLVSMNYEKLKAILEPLGINPEIDF